MSYDTHQTRFWVMFQLTLHSLAASLDVAVIVIQYYCNTSVGSIVQHGEEWFCNFSQQSVCHKDCYAVEIITQMMVISKFTFKHTIFSNPSRRGWMGGCTPRCHSGGVGGNGSKWSGTRSWDKSVRRNGPTRSQWYEWWIVWCNIMVVWKAEYIHNGTSINLVPTHIDWFDS